MDQETIRAIAKESAQAAALAVASSLRESVSEDLHRLENRMGESIQTSFKLHFGEIDAANHVIQHDRLDRLLKTWDKASGNLLGKAMIGVLIVGLVFAFGGEIVLKKITGMFT